MQKLNAELKKILEAFPEEAPKDAAYPYKVFSATRLSDDDEKQVYSLEVNVWDKHEFYSRAESIMDRLEKDVHKSCILTEEFLIQIFKGPRQPVPDPDKEIKRVREQFEMHVYEREG